MRSRLPALTAVVAALLTATVAATPSATAAVATPTQVALVVDYPNGGGSASWCVTYTAGMSGADVLSVASPSYGTGPYAGFVLRVGGQGTTPPTGDNYWAYWTTTNGRLTYSGSGVTSTRPAAGTVEAWHWNSSSTSETPAAGSYASICPSGYTTAGSASSPVATPGGTSGSGDGDVADAPGTAAGTADTSGSGTTGGGSAPGDGDGTPAPTTGSDGPAPTSGADTGGTASAGPGTAAPSGSATPTGGTSTGRSVDASPVAATTDGGGSGGALGLALAGLAVVALGAAAVWQRRRRHADDR